jgi:hypothetical protein
MGRRERNVAVQAGSTRMIRKVYLTALAVSTAICMGCSATLEKPKAQNTAGNTLASAANIVPTLPPGQTPVTEISLNGNLAERTNQKRVVDVPQTGPRATPQSFDAPEDSAITTTMNQSGQVLEIRVFKSHPQLSRVESTWTSPKGRSLKIYLRDGRTRDVTSDNVENLRSVTAAQVLEMIGIRASRSSPPGSGETGVKKRD